MRDWVLVDQKNSLSDGVSERFIPLGLAREHHLLVQNKLQVQERKLLLATFSKHCIDIDSRIENTKNWSDDQAHEGYAEDFHVKRVLSFSLFLDKVQI